MATVKPESKGGVRGVVTDLAIVAGIGLTTYGSWLIYQPAGVIVLGVICLSFGVAAAAVRR